ncbi:ribosomal RNA-processing protein 8 isoform X2 [Dromaius novaehollandiae]|uniref:ribosomal RNA-processing protein 8 isoform X2 n=1 Tax=Dromaius novaehollandiae TaxID=8790 RepID=UPI00311F1917
MFAEEEWKDGAGDAALGPAVPRPVGPAAPQRPAPAGAARRRLLATLQRLAAAAGPQRAARRRAPKRPAGPEGPPSGPGRPRAEPEPEPEPEPEQAGQHRSEDASAELPGDKPTRSPERAEPERGLSAAGPAQRLSRKQWRNKQKNKRRQKNKFKVGPGPGGEKCLDVEASVEPGALESPAAETLPSERSEALRARMEERLLSARFRYINQQLYTSSSQEAARLFQNDPEAFQIYHRGFAQQVGRWPENPVHRIVRYLRQRPASLVVADFGCGDCKIANSIRNKVHSFDLVALSPLVTVCDMAKVPLAAESVDVAVFCLALMGTNLQEILEEANRVLKHGGTLMMAEVASRFEDLRAFVNAMTHLGFKSVSKELKGFNSLDDLLHVKGITTRILELNSQRMTCRRRPSSEEAARVLAEEEEDVSASWEPERSGKGSPGSGPEADGSPEQGAQESVSSRACGEQQEEEEEEEEEEGSCYSEEGEDGSDVYFYYTIGERWIDYLQRTEEGGLLRHVRPKMKRKSENGLDGRALSPGKKLCKGSEYGRTLGPCTPSPTTTFGDLRNAKPGQARRRRIPSVAPPPELQDWLRTFQRWSGPEKLLALDELIDRCEPSQIKYMMQVIEPQFQRDFISLLPKELALYVLSFLEPRDLLRAAQTCRYWRVLAEDNLLWREKCREEGIEEPLNLRKRRLLSPGFMYSPWKFAFMRQHKIDMNWRSGELKAPKVLKGHDDHVITCLQFCGNRIVSGSDDNTLKVWSAVTGECVQTLVGHTGGVWSSQMRDSIVISGSTDRTLKVWNADTGECVHTLYGHTSTVRCMHLHGNRVVSGSRDATLRLWDIETGQCLHVLMGHVAAVRCVQYDGHKVVSGAYDYTVKVWDPESESCTHTLQGHTNRVYSLQAVLTCISLGSLTGRTS